MALQQSLRTNEGELYYIISWVPSSDNSWRINFAGHVAADRSKKAGAGCILRDQNAKFKAACAGPIENCNSLLGAELVGLKYGLILAIKQGVDYIEIEGDYSIAMQVLFHEESTPLSSDNENLAEECYHLLKQFRDVKIRQVSIQSNQGANDLALIVVSLKEPKQWFNEPPFEISETLITDVIGRWVD